MKNTLSNTPYTGDALPSVQYNDIKNAIHTALFLSVQKYKDERPKRKLTTYRRDPHPSELSKAQFEIYQKIFSKKALEQINWLISKRKGIIY
jgi:hypothetical protein